MLLEDFTLQLELKMMSTMHLDKSTGEMNINPELNMLDVLFNLYELREMITEWDHYPAYASDLEEFLTWVQTGIYKIETEVVQPS